MDASILLPPTGTPLTGIDFIKRLPCGEVERARKVSQPAVWRRRARQEGSPLAIDMLLKFMVVVICVINLHVHVHVHVCTPNIVLQNSYET